MDTPAFRARDDRRRWNRGARRRGRPTLLQCVFGIPASELTGAGALGWRLFATRNLYLAARALQGDSTAIAAFGQIQALDQLVFWQAFAKRSVPRPTTIMAAATSAAIVMLDVHRRR